MFVASPQQDAYRQRRTPLLAAVLDKNGASSSESGGRRDKRVAVFVALSLQTSLQHFAAATPLRYPAAHDAILEAR
jgi:hypothetical protein